METTFTIDGVDGYAPLIAEIFTQTQTVEDAPLVLALKGDLGAGKTTFTQQLAKQLGVTEPITSPTFTIMKGYSLTHKKFDQLLHIDAYRFESPDEAAPLGLSQIFKTPRLLVCVEWPERIAEFLPPETITLTFSIIEADVRQVELVTPE